VRQQWVRRGGRGLGVVAAVGLVVAALTVAVSGPATAAGAPTVTNESPISGTNDGGTTVTFTGTGFTGATAVDFGPLPGTSLDVISDTSLTVVTPPFPSGTAVVNIHTPNGTASTTFTFVTPGPPPTVTAVSPTSGLSTGTSVTISGTGFTGADSVTFGGVAADAYLVSSATTIIAESPNEPAGTVDVIVTTPNGTSGSSPADQFTAVAPGPPPTITSVTPNAGTTAGGVSFTVNGAGFTGAQSVAVGGGAAAFVVNSDTSITATSPVEPAGTYDVTVTTPNGANSPSLADQFTVVAPLPVVTGVSPPSGTTDGATSVDVSGTGFTFATAVDFGSTAASSFVVNSDTSVTATSPAGPPGPVDVTVTTAGGTSATGPADQYTFITPPLVVTGISPVTGSTLGGTVVTITGSDFIGANAVDFGTSSAPFVFNSDTSITAVTPPETVGNVDVTVTTPTGTTPATRHGDRFTFVSPATVTKVTPNSGPATGGTVVTVKGKRLTGATAVDFGGVPASFTVVSSDSITATAPVASPGTVNVTVTTPTGTSATSSADSFTFTTPPPVVTAIAPASGSTSGGTVVTITGTAFTGAYAVHFGASLASIVVNSDTSITATSPPGIVGSFPVTVTTLYGTSKKTGASFTYSERVTTPVVTGVSPQAGFTSAKTSDTVTITGTGFSDATAVDFGSVAASSINLISDSTISATSPPNTTAQTVDVTVTTPAGKSTTSAADLFTFVAPGPVANVTGVSPASGPETGGTNVIITGTGLSGATAVDFGAVSVPFILDESTGDLSVTSPPEASATVDVTVTTPNGVSATNARDKFSFTNPQIPPTVSGIRPRRGPAAGGTSVVIHGSGFIGTTVVEFGGVPTTFVVNSGRSITATSPAGKPGTVDVTVSTPNGTSVKGFTDLFTYK
jgi:hypothetical protein